MKKNDCSPYVQSHT